MRAIVWHAREDVRLEEVPVPQPGPNQVVIEVARCGLCGSDRREYDVGPFMIPRHRHPLTGHVGPVILGHEAVGRVIACGTNVAEPPETGARVAVDPTWSCGRCAACHRGQRQLCASAGFSGTSAHGGLASHMAAAADGVVPIPDHVGDDEAALAEPLAVAVHAMARAALQPADRVVVAGFGPIGAAVALTARALGASEVAVIEPSATRRQTAMTMGFADVIDPGAADEPSEALRARRAWADVAVDCSGAPGVLVACIRSTRTGGKVVVPAVAAGLTPVALGQLVLGERSLIGSLGYSGDISRAVRLISCGAVDVRGLISTVLPLSSVPQWFANPAVGGTGLKVLVDPGA